MIDIVINECDSCPRYKKKTPRPAVGLSKADEFDESVTMDLHEIESKLWYIHIIDEFSRFSNAKIIKSKYMSVKTFMKSWISIFGVPSKVFSDNGGEFIGNDFLDMCETFVSTTPSYSPWSNGLVERHLKIKEDAKCDWEIALAWAISAKNALINNKGYSPVMVFAHDGNFVEILEIEKEINIYYYLIELIILECVSVGIYVNICTVWCCNILT